MIQENRTPQTEALSFLSGGGEMGARMRRHDWAASVLGAPEAWPCNLQTLVSLMLGSEQPMFVAWGPERIMLYNDGYAQLCGERHPAAMGSAFVEVWADIMHEVGPILDKAYAGQFTHMDDIAFWLTRGARLQEAHFSVSYTPVRDDRGAVAGVFCACAETTAKVLDERRVDLREQLERRLRDLSTPEAVIETAARMLGEHLGAIRVGYGEDHDQSGEMTIAGRYANGVDTATGRHRYADYDHAMLNELRAGRPNVRSDVAADPSLTPQQKAAFAALDIGALINMPLLKSGRFVALLFVHYREPHAFSESEIALIQDIADRTWEAVERARAETALRNREQSYRALISASNEVLYRHNADWTEMRQLRGGGFLADTDTADHEWFDRYIHPDDQPQVWAAIQDAIKNKTVFELEHRVIRADGSLGWTSSRSVPVLDHRGEVIEWFGAASDVTARKEAEDALRERQERQAFLLKLSDALRPLADAWRIEDEACRLLAERLNADRAYFAGIDEAAGTATIEKDYVRGEAFSLAGKHRLSDFGSTVALLRMGSYAIADFSASDQITDNEREHLAALKIAAAIAVPLIKDRRLVGALCITSSQPRQWADGQIALLQEVSERIFAAVERARAEASLREREAELSRVQKIGGVAGIDVDLTSALLIGKRSPEYVLLHGLPPGMTYEPHEGWLSRIVPEDRERADATLRKAIESGETYFSEYRIRRPSNGEVRWIAANAQVERDAAGRAVRLVGAHIDITRRKQDEEALRLNTERLRHFAESNVVGILFGDVHGGIEYSNDEFLRIVRHTREQLERGEVRWDKITPPEWLPLDAERIAEAKECGSCRPYEKEYALPDGGRVPVLVGFTLFGPTREQFVAFVVDLTARKRMEDALRDSEERHAFLLKLSDAVRPLVNASDILAEMCTRLGEHLGVDRAYYVEVDDALGVARVEGDYLRAAAISLTGEHRIADFSWSVEVLRRGDCHVVDDAQTSPLFSGADRTACAKLDILAWMGAPLMKKDRLIGALCVTQATARSWSEVEVKLLRDVAERIRAEIERARAEAALSESEELFRSFAENSSDTLWIVNDKGQLEYLSPAFEAMWGESRDGMIHDLGRWAELLHPDDRERAGDKLAGVFAGQGFQQDYRIIRASDRTLRWIRDTGFPIPGMDGRIRRVGGIAQDITETKQAEAALSDSRKRYRNVVENARDHAIFTVDLKGRVVDWYAGAEQVFGWAPDEIVGRSSAVLYTPEDRKAGVDEWERRQTIDLGAAPNIRWRMRKNGERIFIEGKAMALRESDGRVYGLLMIGQDVTERRRIEEALRAERERLDFVVNSAGIGLWLNSLPLGELNWNAQVKEHFHMPPDAPPPRIDEFYDRLHPDDRVPVREAVARSVETGEQFNAVYRTIHPETRAQKWVRAIGLPIANNAGVPTRFDGVTLDITAVKEAEEHRTLLINELNHRVKNTLATVQSLAMQTFRTEELSADGLRLFESRLAALSRAHDVLTSNNWEKADLRTVVREALEPFTPRNPQIAARGPQAPLSPKQALALSMALHELATNAVKYGALSTSRGRIDVSWSVTRDRDGGDLTLTWTERGGPTVAPPQRKGFGSRLIERSLALDLNGEASIHYEAAGVVARVKARLQSS
ncbi:MAG: PAS domain-containing protein [Hyphomicrobiales bacterium]|nr:PAS domain-containing protein [Hyphomicrobiales bacterium]